MMSKRLQTLLTVLLLVALSAALAFGTELFVQRKLLLQPAPQQTDRVLDPSLLSVKTGAATEEEALPAEGGAAEDAEEGEGADEALQPEEAEDDFAEETADEETKALSLPDKNATLQIAYTGYVEYLVLRAEVDRDQTYTVTATLADGSRKTYRSMFSAKFQVDSIHIGETVNAMTLKTAAGMQTISAVEVANRFRLHPARMLLVALSALAALLLVVFRQAMAQKPERAFLVVALAAGMLIAGMLPTNIGLSWDDEAHAVNAFHVSNLSIDDSSFTALLPAFGFSMSDATDSYSVHGWDTEYDHALFRADQDATNGKLSPRAHSLTWDYSKIGVLPMAAGIAAARLLGLGNAAQMIGARLMNMLCYVLVCYFAVRSLKRFRWLMAAVALFPSGLYLASSFSYDMFPAALCYLGTAIAVSAILEGEKLTWGKALTMLLAFLVGGIAKTVYMPLMLLMLLIPRQNFADRRAAVWFKVGSMLVLAVALGSMVLNVAGDVNSTLMDDRGGGDSKLQMEFLKTHPLTYFSYFLRFIWTNFRAFFVDIPRTNWGYLGGVPAMADLLSMGVLLFAIFADRQTGHAQVGGRRKLAFLLIGGLCVGLVMTTMYVAFSDVGKYDFGGVQARYMLPVLPLLYMVLSPDHVENGIPKERLTACFYLVNLLMLMLTVLHKIVLVYYA